MNRRQLACIMAVLEEQLALIHTEYKAIEYLNGEPRATECYRESIRSMVTRLNRLTGASKGNISRIMLKMLTDERDNVPF